jgi:hypothetical protein
MGKPRMNEFGAIIFDPTPEDLQLQELRSEVKALREEVKQLKNTVKDIINVNSENNKEE